MGPVVILAPIVGILFLQPPFGSAAVGVACIGFAFGVELDLLALFVIRYLGTKAFGADHGPDQRRVHAGRRVRAAAARDRLRLVRLLRPVLPVLMGTLVVCAILIVCLGRYRYPPLAGFDDLAAKDELAAAEVLSDIAEGEDSADAGRGREAVTTDPAPHRRPVRVSRPPRSVEGEVGR